MSVVHTAQCPDLLLSVIHHCFCNDAEVQIFGMFSVGWGTLQL